MKLGTGSLRLGFRSWPFSTYSELVLDQSGPKYPGVCPFALALCGMSNVASGPEHHLSCKSSMHQPADQSPHLQHGRPQYVTKTAEEHDKLYVLLDRSSQIRRHNLSNLTDSQRFTPSHIMVAGVLWNCQSAVQKADFISALASLHFLHFLALTETWITPENSATPAALSSAFSFTHSLRRLGRGGGTGLLMSCEWRFTPLSFSTLSISSFEFHAITVSFPTNLLIIVIYRTPDSLDHFIDELDILLSQFPMEGNPLILLGDFNLPSDKLHSSCILPLLTAFGLTLNHSPPTHKAGNVLDLIFTRTTTTSDIANQLHDPNQSGYKRAHSTETALIAVTEKLHAAKAAKQSSVLILLDLSAAFDTVNHNILLSVLSRLGVTGSWRWFQSYLDGRSYQKNPAATGEVEGQMKPCCSASATYTSIAAPSGQERGQGLALRGRGAPGREFYSSHKADELKW
ncbi:hypothetical protein P4O66_000362 [Electrophorus voltai]|uniref:Reverse transcriptase domain-containing protein n=1 Tax=Electrophorus voltai TaxID=2609070 RepID=A0AAD8ZHH6_9TELE|nr:hypothetical protein P4O66_000362 [Electrophorus voltai]